MPTPKRDLLDSTRQIIKSERIMHAPGSVIGNRYQIIQKLGRTEMGKTYLAKDLQATGDARCAIEQLSPNSNNEAHWQVIKQYLLNEIAVLQRLGDHPQIPQFYNYFIENKQFYLVREYIDGDNLEQEVERKIFEEADAIFLIQDVLRILDFIHKTNVIHRDVQPIHLIRRKRDQSFVLINFGAIRALESTVINLQGESVLSKPLGNWAYVPSEQQTGESHFSDDIYALARTAVYALTGRSPQAWEQTNDKWQEHCQISDTLEAILNKMMSSSIEERYGSAIDVLMDLCPLLKIRQVVGGRYAITQYLEGDDLIETYLADNLRRQYQSPCLIKIIELPNAHGYSKVKIERRFAEELSILERLGYHEQIPQLWDHFEENDEFYLVQAYVSGESLARKIEQQDLSLLQIIQILTSTLVVLGFIHQNRIIHRNLKPSTLLIRHEDQQVMPMDFGILRDIKILSHTNLDFNSNSDRENYWSPEQIAGRPTLSSDLYALGMTVIEALTKTKPSKLQRERKTGKLLWQQNINLDRRIVKIIDKMIDLDLGKRYQSAEEVLNDLQKINVVAYSRARQPVKASISKVNRSKFYQSPLSQIAPFIVGLVGIIFLLGSIEFAFPTLRPFYYWHQGKKLLTEQPQSALNTFTKAIDLKPSSALAWSGRGQALYNLERYSEALESYYEATQLDKTDFKNWQKQGDALYQLERYTGAIAAYNRALELEQNNAKLFNRKGRALYELQNYESALAMQESALKIDRLNAQFLSDRANNLLALGRYYDALTEFNRVQAVQPFNVQLWQNKSLVLKDLGRPEEAERVKQEVLQNYQSILTNQALNHQILLAKADFLAANQMYQQAINVYNQAIEIKPNFYQAWLAKGKVLTQLGQEQKALVALDKALQIRPQSYLALQAKGLIYQNNQNNYAAAIAEYQQAIDINPDYAPLWRDRGLALNQQGNYKQAIESLTQASKIAPLDPETWVGLATAWERLGRDQKALSALDRAIKIKPEDPKIWSQKGLIYTQNAQYDQACDTYRQSRLIIPNSEIILDSMRTLGCRMN
jgi:eukaryotic-like serine/threonine-protein kinase